ncbi:MAG: AAA family ATPase, partial [Planctomycetota bacterium]
MKFQRISIENFGSFPRRDLDFSGASLAIIYGPNEAGKTTALNAIRQAVFGFRARTPYLTGRTITASVSATLADGSTLEFTRRKGRPDQIDGTHRGADLNEARLRNLLGDVDLDCYEQMFGFSQEELRLGQQTLKDAKLTEALAGGTFGGIHALEGLRTELSENLQSLYKARGSTSAINVLLREIEEANQKLKTLEVPASLIEDIQRQIAGREEERVLVVSRLEATRRSRTQARRQLQSFPLLQQILAIRSFLDEIEIPDGIDRNFVMQWKEQADRREKLSASLAKDREELASTRTALGPAGSRPDLLQYESKI